ncbi:MAG: hypothetical protein WD013_03600 [Gemmatimonadota bacterium]
MAQKSSGGFSTVAMIVAFLAIAGFLYWLSIASEPAQVAVAEEDVTEEVQSVSFEAFGQDPPMYQGRNIRIEDVPVERVFGSAGFMTMLPDSTPYVISLAPTQTGQVVPGDQATIVGTVEPIGQTVLQGWVEDALFLDEAELDAIAAGGNHFVVDELILDDEVEGMEDDATDGATDDTSTADDAQP